MRQNGFSVGRRNFIIGIGAGALVMSLEACQSVSVGGGSRASSEAAGQMAAIRSENGLETLKPDRELETAALTQAGYMAGSGIMNHKTGWRRDFATRISDVDTRGLSAENIAHGRFDTARVIDVWMHSPPHRRNMLDSRFARFGLASAPDPKADGRLFWAMVLAA